jgi:hypothetical protein
MGHFTDEQRAKSIQTRRDKLKVKGAKNRQQLLDEQITNARDRGLSIEEVAKECRTNVGRVKKILFDGVRKAERIQRFNESLVARSAKGIAVVDQWLDKGDKDVAMWLLKETGVVGKEQTNITINAHNAQINTLSNDTLEAARAVAELMRAPAVRKQLQPATDEIVGEVIEQEADDEVAMGEGEGGRAEETDA